jgi:hypothetical protein
MVSISCFFFEQKKDALGMDDFRGMGLALTLELCCIAMHA